MMVNMIDELNRANITRFSLAPMQDKEMLTKVKAKGGW